MYTPQFILPIIHLQCNGVGTWDFHDTGPQRRISSYRIPVTYRTFM